MPNTRNEMTVICGNKIRKNYHTLENPFTFTTEKPEYFAGHSIPKGTECKFFETSNFGFLSWRDPNTGKAHLANE